MEQVFYYIIGTGLYIMMIHFAMGIKGHFRLSSMIAIFVIGGALGYFLGNIFVGFIFACIFTFIFW